MFILASDTASLRLATDWAPTDGAGTLRFVLSNTLNLHLGNFQLAFTSLFPLIVQDQQLEGAHLAKQESNYHLIRPSDGLTLPPGAHWSFSAQVGCELQHYTSAVKSAYVILEDGATIPVVSLPTTRGGERGAPRLGLPPSSRLPSGEPAVALVPFPASVHVDGAREPASALCLAEGPAEAEIAFRAAAGLSERLFRAEPPLFAPSGDIKCVARHSPGPNQEDYAVEFAPDVVAVRAAGPAGFLYAFISLGQILRAARLDRAQFRFPARGEIRDRPRFEWRGMLLDVARQVFSPTDLSWMLDCLAWHKFNRLHLHLSDDEGWRLDIPAVPQLAELGGWRGHGLAIPPRLGSAAERCGMIYSAADIGSLVRRAAQLSVTIVPEIDMPDTARLRWKRFRTCAIRLIPGRIAIFSILPCTGPMITCKPSLANSSGFFLPLGFTSAVMKCLPMPGRAHHWPDA